ncbi:MAG: YggS family pyridoxal phosphate-dependent enzyme [Rikenellaceae bacterium]
MSITSTIEQIIASIDANVRLIAVSKTYPEAAIEEAYSVGQRHFGESRPQEMVRKWEALPKDIEWHMIGHLQRNKVRMIAPFVSMIESLDSERLAQCVNDEAARCGRVIDCLLEIHVAQEESKTGWNIEHLREFIDGGGFAKLPNIRVRGVMGIASNTDDEQQVRCDFEQLAHYKESLAGSFDESFDTLSMGMSHDYALAIECGSNNIRVGSLIFGNRVY